MRDRDDLMSDPGSLIVCFLLGMMIGFGIPHGFGSPSDNANPARSSTHITANLDSWAGGVRTMDLPSR